MSELYRLVYVSQAKEGLADADIGHIIEASESNNHERFITGFLTLNHGRFMQVLEGPEEEVRDVYGRIRDDTRHCCVTQIIGEQDHRRIFPDWTMNYFRVDSEQGSPTMRMKRGEVEELMPAGTPQPYLYLFSRFMAQR